MDKEGIVVKTENEMATVIIKTIAACDTCRADCKGHCDKAKPISIEAKNPLKAEIGDSVTVYTKTGVILAMAIFTFIVPIVVTATTVFLFAKFIKASPLPAIFGIIAFSLTIVLLYLFFKNKNDSDIFTIKQINGKNKNGI